MARILSRRWRTNPQRLAGRVALPFVGFVRDRRDHGGGASALRSIPLQTL